MNQDTKLSLVYVITFGFAISTAEYFFRRKHNIVSRDTHFVEVFLLILNVYSLYTEEICLDNLSEPYLLNQYTIKDIFLYNVFFNYISPIIIRYKNELLYCFSCSIFAFLGMYNLFLDKSDCSNITRISLVLNMCVLFLYSIRCILFLYNHPN